MKAVQLACVLLAVCSSALAEKVVVNKEVDAALAAFAQRVIKQKTNYIPVIDFEGLGVTAKGIVAGDLATISRLGDATVERNGNVDVFKMSMTLKSLIDLVDKFTINGKTFGAMFIVGRNTFNMEAEIVRTGGSCATKWKYFQIDEFDNVKMMAADPEYNNLDVSDTFKNQVKNQVNEFYKTPMFLAFMNTNVNLCIE